MTQGYNDKKLICIESSCGNEFIFPATEQDFFARLREEDPTIQDPKRCPRCRKNRKHLRHQNPHSPPALAPVKPEPVRTFTPTQDFRHPAPARVVGYQEHYPLQQPRTNVVQRSFSEKEIILKLREENAQLREEIEELNEQLKVRYPARESVR